MYDGPLRCNNILARLYLYSYMVQLDNVKALACPASRLDVLHSWNDAMAHALLQRLILPHAHLATLEHGQPTSRTQECVRALRTFPADANTPWTCARTFAQQSGVASCELEDIPVDTSAWQAKTMPTRRVDMEPLPPRRTRSAARLQAAIQALDTPVDDEDESEGEEDDGEEDDSLVGRRRRRRSKRAEAMAAKRQRTAVIERAQRILGPPSPVKPLVDDAPRMSLEAKVACLVELCDALSMSRAPHESPLHRLVQPVVEQASEDERAAKQHVQDINDQCDTEMRAHKKQAPSMASTQYGVWKARMHQLTHTHDCARFEARTRHYFAQRRACGRSGPLGRDDEGREYWHVLPACDPSDMEAPGAERGVHAPFSGHWSHVLLVREAANSDRWYATTSADQVAAILAYLGRRRRTDETLHMHLAGVQDYLAWLDLCQAGASRHQE